MVLLGDSNALQVAAVYRVGWARGVLTLLIIPVQTDALMRQVLEPNHI